jgi:hypothetical protein
MLNLELVRKETSEISASLYYKWKALSFGGGTSWGWRGRGGLLLLTGFVGDSMSFFILVEVGPRAQNAI